MTRSGNSQSRVARRNTAADLTPYSSWTVTVTSRAACEYTRRRRRLCEYTETARILAKALIRTSWGTGCLAMQCILANAGSRSTMTADVVQYTLLLCITTSRDMSASGWFASSVCIVVSLPTRLFNA